MTRFLTLDFNINVLKKLTPQTSTYVAGINSVHQGGISFKIGILLPTVSDCFVLEQNPFRLVGLQTAATEDNLLSSYCIYQ